MVLHAVICGKSEDGWCGGGVVGLKMVEFMGFWSMRKFELNSVDRLQFS